jgi:serine/threonine protein kinase HipA of HipAB toxin-antitoxin module
MAAPASSPAVAALASETPDTASPTEPATDASAPPPARIGADPLLSAFRQLLAARRPADAGDVPADGVEALVAFLQRMSQSLGGQAASTSSVPGTLLDVTP